MINIHNLTKTFDNKLILDNISLYIERGDRVAIIGPSGCGKSTLLKILTGLLHFEDGEIEINNHKINSKSYSNNDIPIYMKEVGMLFQTAALFDSINVKENIAFYLREKLNITNENKINEIVATKLELVNMQNYEKIMPANLSGGQKKRIGLARALSKNPKIMFYDEPTTGLDPLLSTNIENLIIDLSEKLNVTSLIITHQHSTILRTAKKIYYLDNGHLIGPETPETITHSSHKKIREFFNSKVE